MRISNVYIAGLILMCCIIRPQQLLANAAQPGVWNAGGTVFTMLYPEDSLSFRKVQMQQEAIYIQLYKGFAVVKGTYQFKNTSTEKLQFKMGYPINGIYNGGANELNQVQLEGLNRFRVKIGEQWLPMLQQSHEAYSNFTSFGNNWLVWEMSFMPVKTQTVEVYFIVNTNNAVVRQGYRTAKRNAFIYLLESGSVWRQPIEKGDFYIQLMDELTVADMKGLSAGFNMRFNDTHKLLYGNKTWFSPTPTDNLIITYADRIENFSFEERISADEQLFSKVNQLSSLPFQNLKYKAIVTADPFEVKASFWDSFIEGLVYFVFAAPYIIIVLLVLIGIWVYYKWKKVSKKINKQ
ncbi:MAG: hypothetical protein ACK4S0_00450 [Sediminibacterium sp.]